MTMIELCPGPFAAQHRRKKYPTHNIDFAKTAVIREKCAPHCMDCDQLLHRTEHFQIQVVGVI